MKVINYDSKTGKYQVKHLDAEGSFWITQKEFCMSINQKINAKGNAITWRLSVTPQMIIKRNYKQPYEGMFCPNILLPKQWKTNYEEG